MFLQEDLKEIFQLAVKAGVNFFDTAEVIVA
jgi:aryl-alcohol dehydrogenase-like predicted oxidoreductase